MDLVQVDPIFNLYDPDWPLRTYQPQFPPAKFVFDEDGRRGSATDSLVSMGCIVSGSQVCRSILGLGVRVHSYCDVQDTIVLPNATLNRHSRVRRAIIDRGVVLPRGAVIGYDPVEDRRRHTVSEGGVVVVTPGEECLRGGNIRSVRLRHIESVFARAILDSRGNPTVEAEVTLENGAFGRAAVALRRLHRRAGGGGGARRQQAPLARPGRGQGGGRRQRRARLRGHGRGRARPGADRPAHDRAGRHAQQEPAGRQRDPRRVAGRGQGGGGGVRPAALPLRGRRPTRARCPSPS